MAVAQAFCLCLFSFRVLVFQISLDFNHRQDVDLAVVAFVLDLCCAAFADNFVDAVNQLRKISYVCFFHCPPDARREMFRRTGGCALYIMKGGLKMDTSCIIFIISYDIWCVKFLCNICLKIFSLPYFHRFYAAKSHINCHCKAVGSIVMCVFTDNLERIHVVHKLIVFF